MEDKGFLTKKCGTPGFVAPEVLTGDGYSFKADIFSLGCVFFSLLTGCYLFVGSSVQELLRSNMKCDVSDIQKYITNVSALGKDLFYQIITKDPTRRPSAKEALLHPWFHCDKAALKELLFINSFVCSQKKAASKKSCKNTHNAMNMLGAHSKIGSFLIADNFFRDN